MFAKATSNFVKQIDSDGELIPVARLNDSDKLQPLCLVIKRKRFWFWQKPKYISSPFTLSDVLTGDKPIKPVVVESDFLKYEGTFGDAIAGNVETEVGGLNIKGEGKGSSKLQSSFGDLRKQEVDVLYLLQDSEKRVINMDHPFVQQTRERLKEVCGVLKEKIITTQKCSISEQIQEGHWGSMLWFRAKQINVSVQENRNIQKDSNVVLEIPPETVLAYSIIELSIKTDGQYKLCLLPDKCGGFEAEARKKSASPDLISLLDGAMESDGGSVRRKRSEDVRNIPSEAPLAVLKQDLEEFKTQFKPFAEMPEDKRATLFKMVNKVLYDKAVVIVVENVMFAKATSNFVKQIDSDGELIPVARLNDSDKLQPLCLVIKRKRFWFWQKPKYISSPFTLSDVLTGDKPIKPVVVESDFLKYEGTFGDAIAGNVETEVGGLNIKGEGKGSSKLQSSFGDLRKQEVDVLYLLQDSEKRVINMDHPFVQQTRERLKEVCGVLKEKIITTQKCSISEQIQEGHWGSMLWFRAKQINVSVQENRNIQKDSNVVLEIPPETVLAYSIIELSIKTDGQYKLCLLPDKCGGFEAEARKKSASPDLISLLDGAMESDGGSVRRKRSEDVRNIPSEAPLAVLKQEMPEDKRATLFKMVNKVLYDKAVVIVVENVLEQLSSGEKPDLTELEELNPSQKACATTLLQAIGYSCEEQSQLMETDSLHRSPRLLTATHFLVSAMEVCGRINLQ
ncbi:UNVERIFIED_CONTAM: hypothetical protein FKN15_037407 [Acipenser sinensis]